MQFAQTLSDPVRKRARADAILSTLFGCISEQIVDSNTLLILYLGMLGSGESVLMFSTALTGIASGVLAIPSAGLVNKFGLRHSYSGAIYAKTLTFLVIAAAPFTGRAAEAVVMVACFLFCLFRAFYGATWLPLVDSFLRPEERIGFFGTMRFSYMLFNVLLIFGIGTLMQGTPSIWILQIYFAIAGLGLLVRKYYLDRFPIAPHHSASRRGTVPSLKISIRNSRLVGFSFYFGFLNLTALSAFPLAVIYMKNGLGLGASTIMIITATGLCGSIVGYALVKPLYRRCGMRVFELLTHLIFLAAIGLLLTLSPQWQGTVPLLGLLFFFNGIANAFMLCFGSTEMLALAHPGNKVMAMAFSSTFQYLGNALGRLGTTAILALGVLASTWVCCGREFTHFHTLFLFDFVLTLIGMLFLLLTPGMIKHREDYYEP